MSEKSGSIYDEFDEKPENIDLSFPKNSFLTKNLKRDAFIGVPLKTADRLNEKSETKKSDKNHISSTLHDFGNEKPISMNLNDLKTILNNPNSVTDYSFSEDFEHNFDNQSEKKPKNQKSKLEKVEVDDIQSINLCHKFEKKLKTDEIQTNKRINQNKNVSISKNVLNENHLSENETIPKSSNQTIQEKDKMIEPVKKFLTLKELNEEKKSLMTKLKENNESLTKMVEEQGYKNLLKKMKDNKTDFKNRPNDVKSNTYQREIANNEKVIITLFAEKTLCEQNIAKINSPEYLVNITNETAEQKRLIKLLKSEIHARNLENKKNAKLFTENKLEEKSSNDLNKILKEVEAFVFKNTEMKAQIEKLNAIHCELLAKKEIQKITEEQTKPISENLNRLDSELLKSYKHLTESKEKWLKHLELLERNVYQKSELLEKEIECLSSKQVQVNNKIMDYDLIVERQNSLLIKRAERTDDFEELDKEEIEIQNMIADIEKNHKFSRPINFRGQPQKVDQRQILNTKDVISQIKPVISEKRAFSNLKPKNVPDKSKDISKIEAITVVPKRLSSKLTTKTKIESQDKQKIGSLPVIKNSKIKEPIKKTVNQEVIVPTVISLEHYSENNMPVLTNQLNKNRLLKFDLKLWNKENQQNQQISPNKTESQNSPRMKNEILENVKIIEKNCENEEEKNMNHEKIPKIVCVQENKQLIEKTDDFFEEKSKNKLFLKQKKSLFDDEFFEKEETSPHKQNSEAFENDEFDFLDEIK